MTVCLQLVHRYKGVWQYNQRWSDLLTQKDIDGLKAELKEAQKVISEGETLEPVLRETIRELEENMNDLKVTYWTLWCT